MKFIAHGYQTEPATDQPYLIVEHELAEKQIAKGVMQTVHVVKVLAQFALIENALHWLEENYPGVVL